MVDPADSQLRLVLAVRADFYGRCAQIGWLAEKITANQVLVGPMERENMRRAIEEPARRSGLRLEPGLVEAVLLEGGASASSLPLISHALVETWVRRDANVLTLSGFRMAGGVAGAIAQSADTLFNDALSAEQQTIARRLLLRLVTPGEGTTSTRRRVPLEELDRDPAPQKLHTVVDAFVTARLLSVDDSSVEIAHEALIGSWPRLRSWIDAERENLRAQQRIGRAAREWDANGRDSDLLYRGAPLVAAADWATHHRESLDVLERQFLDESESARELEGPTGRDSWPGLTATDGGAPPRHSQCWRWPRWLFAARRSRRFGAPAIAPASPRNNSPMRLARLRWGRPTPIQPKQSCWRLKAWSVDPPPPSMPRSALVQARLALSRPGLTPLGPSISTPGSFKVALRPDGLLAAVADQTGPIRLFDTRTGVQVGADLIAM